MSHPVSSFITVYGKSDVLVPEVDRIQHALAQHDQATMSREELLKVIYDGSADTPPPTDSERWPKWIAPEFRSRDFLTFISANHSVDEIQDHLTSHLATMDARIITLMEWENWPRACGARIAFMHATRLVSIGKEGSQDAQILRNVYYTSSEEEDEASVSYMWDEIGHCTEYVKAMARRACPRIRNSAFSKTLF